MSLNKTHLIAVAAILLFGLSISFAPNSFDCPRYRPSFCGLFTNAIMIVGGAIVISGEVGSRLLPGTEVLVELDNGDRRQAILTRKATSGRLVSTGDRVRLNCKKAHPAPDQPGAKICELEFPRFDPNSPCVKGSPCYGQIPSWTISVDEQGNPSPSLMKFR